MVSLADSGALRQRRSKAHKSGDHSLCGSRCTQGRARPVLTVLPPAPESGFDPVAEMRGLAVLAVAAYRADTANAVLLREARMTLRELMPKDAGGADADLTGLFAALQA